MRSPKRGGWMYGRPPTAPFQINRQSPQARGLVAWWPMQGQYGSAGLVHDYVADRFQLTQSNTPTWARDGEMGSAVVLNGTNQRLIIDEPIVTAVPFTMTCWFNSDDAANNQFLVAVAGYVGGAAGRYYGLTARGNAVGDPIAASVFNGTGTSSALSASGYTVGKWHLAVGVFFSSTYRAAYIDGAHEGTNTDNRIADNLTRSAVGTLYRSDNPAVYTDGKIADARIYDRALSPAEIWALYDPSTRWELYQPVSRVWVGTTPPAPAPAAATTQQTIRIGGGGLRISI